MIPAESWQTKIGVQATVARLRRAEACSHEPIRCLETRVTPRSPQEQDGRGMWNGPLPQKGPRRC